MSDSPAPKIVIEVESKLPNRHLELAGALMDFLYNSGDYGLKRNKDGWTLTNATDLLTLHLEGDITEVPDAPDVPPSDADVPFCEI